MRKDGIKQNDPDILRQEGLPTNLLTEVWRKDTYEKLLKLDQLEGKEYKIPYQTHVVYFTHLENPTPIKDLYLKKYYSNLVNLSKENANFKFYFWTNNPDIVPNNIKEFPNFEIRDVSEFKDHKLFPIFSKLIEDGQLDSRKFVQASDVARIVVLENYGGIYHDIDYEVLNAKEMNKYMRSFDYFNAKEDDNKTVGNAYIAAKQGHPIVKEMSNLIDRNLNKLDPLPDYIKYPNNLFNKVLMETGPVAITIATFKALNKDGNIDMVFPDKILYDFLYVRAVIDNPGVHIPLLQKDFEGLKLTVIGADMFSGNWGSINKWEYFDEIEYNVERALDAIAKGLDVNVKDEFFASTALHNSVFRGKLQIASSLIEKGAEINAADDYLRTPLHYAAKLGDVSMVKLLLDKGANASAIDIDGLIAYNLSTDNTVKNILNPEANTSDGSEENNDVINTALELQADGEIVPLETLTNISNPKKNYYLIKKIEPVSDGAAEEINTIHDNISWEMTLVCTASLAGLAAATGMMYYCYHNSA